MSPTLTFLSFQAFVLSCSFPKEPAGGEVSVTHLHPGGEAYFHCFTGYKLQGLKMLTCRNATTPYWSGKDPQCVGKAKSCFVKLNVSWSGVVFIFSLLLSIVFK